MNRYDAIGQRLPISDAVEKVTGEIKYADDLRFSGMLWGAVLASPVAHARIRSIDISKALALPGVRAVITHEDSPDVVYNRIMRWSEDGLPATERVLDRVVRFVGDKVAAVAAESESVAKRALRLIEVDYDLLPAVFDPKEALRGDAPAIYPDGNLLKELLAECGDIDEAAARADLVVTNRLKTARIHHGAIEPHVCIARWGRNDELTVWEPQQGVHRVQIMLGRIFSLPYSKIHVHSPAIGGTFGGKDGIMLEPLALLLSKKAGGAPVKIRYDRRQSIVSTYTRHAMELEGKIAAEADGTLTGFEVRAWMNVGPYCGGSINVQSAMCGKMFKLYRAPSMRFHSLAAYTNTPIGGAMRGFGSPKVFAVLELLINKAAQKLGIDPMELRLKNLVDPFAEDPVAQNSLGSAKIRQCLLEGAEAFDWKRRWQERKKENDDTYLYGYGLATALHGNGVAPFAPDITVAELMLHEDGSVLLRTGLTDHGAGTYTLIRQIVGDILQMPLEQIGVTHSDTDSCPYDMGSGASRNTWSGGAAVQAVAVQMLETMKSAAAEALGTTADSVELKDGLFCCAGSDKALTRAEIATYAYSVQKRKLLEVISYCSDINAGSYGAHFTKVRVNRLTGCVDVLEYLASCDVGTQLNPLLLEGQVEGAVAMGLGMALFEELQLDDAGRPLNATFKKYRLPRASDMPAVRLHFVDNFEDGGPFGGKSIGEASIVPVVPAIVAAVSDAVGAEFDELPLTPDKVLSALNEQKDGLVDLPSLLPEEPAYSVR